MALFRPTALKKNIFELSPDFFSNLGVKALLLDVDNTVAAYVSHEPVPGAPDWVRGMEKAGLKLIIVSNNFKKRVSSFAVKFNLPFISFALKPFPFGYIKASRRLKLKHGECAIVGDQIFTDIVGANMCGMKSVLLTPIEPEDGVSFKIRRYFERPLRRKFENDPGLAMRK